MWADAQRDGCPAEYRWHPLLNTAKWGLTPTNRVSCSNAANIRECKTWTESEFCTWENTVKGKSPRKCIYSLPARETADYRAKFDRPPLSDVSAVTKARRETRRNLLGCPKFPNRYQPLVGRRSPHCENMWGRYCCLTSLFPIAATLPLPTA